MTSETSKASEPILQTLARSARTEDGKAATKAATKIVATIGPASEDRIGELIDAGLSVARINFSHGENAEHRRRVEKIRAAAAERGVPIGILADLAGPKLRLGRMPDGPRTLLANEEVRLVEGETAATGSVPCNVPGVLGALRAGHRVLLCDAAVELVVEGVHASHALARVRRPGEISDRKGVHLPDSTLPLEFPTEQDREHIQLARELGIDMLGLSFVSEPSEIERVRDATPGILMVAKIERLAALKNLKSLLEAADGLMVARGDLGVELNLEQLPLVQKSIIQEALKAGKFTITATEMLESMIEHSRPTRAEVTDVANAVLDGTDAVMLSAETAVGQYPVEAVSAMTRIARAVETSLRYRELPRVGFRQNEPTFSNATALAAAQAAEALDIQKIVCFTETGNSVRLLSRYRTAAEIIALTPNERTLNGMTVLSHVRPMNFARGSSLEDMLHGAQTLLLERGMVAPGEEVIFVAGVPPGVSRSTNVMKLHRIGEVTRLH
ncbi:MAG: pyruvate kinase [Planctomycetes bacterium]|nr:pyruvate kinase [Planctomycetota bacterium]